MWWLLYFLWGSFFFCLSWSSLAGSNVCCWNHVILSCLDIFVRIYFYYFHYLLSMVGSFHVELLWKYNSFSILQVSSACTDFEARMASQMAKLHSWSCCCCKNKWNYLWELHGHIKSKFYLTFLIRWSLIAIITLDSYFPAFKWRSFWFLKGWNDTAEDQRA